MRQRFGTGSLCETSAHELANPRTGGAVIGRTSTLRSLRGGHRHRGPLPAPDGGQDVLRLLTDYDGAPPEHADLPGLPRPARRAADHQPARGRARPGDRGWPSRRRCRPRRAGIARTTSTRTCPRATRSASSTCRWPRTGSLDVRDLGRAGHGGHHGGPTSRRTRPGSSTGWTAAGARSAWSTSTAPACPLMEIVTEPDIRTAEQARALRRGAAPAAAVHRRVGGGHGERPDAGRGQRLAPAARDGAVRDPGRGQEHELVPRGRAGDRLRDRAPGGGPRRRRGAASRRRAAGRRNAARPT